MSFYPAEMIDRLRVFCVDCEKRAEVVWRMPIVDMAFVVRLRVRCHGEERLAELPMIMIRKLHTISAGNLDVLWSELQDYGDDAALAAWLRSLELSKKQWCELSVDSIDVKNTAIARHDEEMLHVREVIAWRLSHR